MKIFGGILPFIGFREEWLPFSEAPYKRSHVESKIKDGELHFHVDALEIEWLGCGAIILMRPYTI